MEFPTYENPTAYHAQAVLDNTDLKAMSVAATLTGVISGCAVSANSTMGAAIASGTIIIGGTSYATSGGTVTLTSASVGDRRDIVYATWSGSAVAFTALAGTPGTAGWTFGTQSTPPIKPNLPSNAVLLAEIYVVGTGATPTTTITSSEIVDKRCLVTLDATKLPLASGLTSVVKTTSYSAVAGDFVIMNGSGNTTTTLPTTPANGAMVGLLNVGTGTATLVAGGSDTIRGSTTSGASVSSSQYQTLIVSYNSASGVWEQVVADANKGYLSRTNSWVGTNTFSNTVTNNGLTVMGPTASVTGPSVTVKQPIQTATVTAASGNGTTVTYTAANSFTVGNLVNISGLGTASGTSLNLVNQTIATASSTQFTVTSTVVGVSSGTGTATSFLSSQYGLQVQNATGNAVFQTGNYSNNLTTLTEALSHSGSFITVASSSFIGTLSLRNYSSGNLPGLTIYQNGANTGDLISLRTTAANTLLRANTSGAWITGSGATSFVVRAAQNTASITAISGNGTTITVTANNYFSAGQTVVITGTTNYNGTYTIASATGSSFTITSGTTGATSTGTATTTGQTADVLQVQDTASTALFGVSNTGSAGSPVWAVNAYSNKVTGVANGTTSTDAVNYGQISTLSMAGKNYFINGALDFWQRGTSFSSGANAYTADRWFAWGGFATAGAYTVSQQTGVGLTGFQNSIRMQRTNASTNTTNPFMGQSFETSVFLPLAGQTIIYSFYARAGANFSAAGGAMTAAVATGTGTDQQIGNSYTGTVAAGSVSAALTTSWQRFTGTVTLGSTATEMALQFSYLPVGTAGANDWFEVTGVQVELGSVLTNFNRAGGHPDGELKLCQRYAFLMPHSTTGFAVNATTITFFAPHPFMRTAPTGSFITTSINVDNGITNVTSSGSTLSASTTYNASGSRLFVTGFSGLTTGGYWGLGTYPSVLLTAEL